MTMSFSRLLPTLALSIGCAGNAVDLGHADAQGWSDAPEPESAEAAPQTIYQSDERVLSFTIDETTLYALIAHSDSFELVACPIEACRSQRTTLYRGPALIEQRNQSTALRRVADSLVWRVDDDGAGAFHGIASCPRTGCDELTLVPASSLALAVDETHVYWIDDQGYVMRLAPGAREPELVWDLNPELLAVQPRAAVGKDFFFFEQHDAIYAVRKDGTAGAQLVVKDPHIADLEARGEDLYYSTRLLTGSINRCEATRCADTRAAVASGQPWPLELHVANDAAFWLNQRPIVGETSHASLTSCALPDCSAVQKWGIEFVVNHIDPDLTPFSFALNQRYVVWVERFHDLGSGLRRVAR